MLLVFPPYLYRVYTHSSVMSNISALLRNSSPELSILQKFKPHGLGVYHLQ